MSQRILVTGAAGFIGGYVVQALLESGWYVKGLDNFSKYGPVRRTFDNHPRYAFHFGDAKDVALMKRLLEDCDHLLAGAAMVGGIGYFHSLPYDLLAENERIMASTFDAALEAYRSCGLRKVTVISSSMVYEGATRFPTAEGDECSLPPPRSAYGFQKLACEYFARAAFQQYGLPFTIVRPFNCIGVGESGSSRLARSAPGNERLASSHVVPDLVVKTLEGQDPLHILGDGGQVRHYTYGGDLARGILACITHPAAENADFNLSSEVSTSVLDLARLVWHKVRGDAPFRYVADEPFEHDVRRRVPDCSKARRLLGFEAVTPLEAVLDEVIAWHRGQIGGQERWAERGRRRE